MAKAKRKATPKPKIFPNDEPVKLTMSFAEAIKKAVNTPIEKNKK